MVGAGSFIMIDYDAGKPFKISIQIDELRELYGQGNTLLDAMVNLGHAVNEYGDQEDKAALAHGWGELAGALRDFHSVAAALQAPCPCGRMTVNDCAGECEAPELRNKGAAGGFPA